MPDVLLYAAFLSVATALGIGIVVFVSKRTGMAEKLTPRDWRIVIMAIGAMVVPAGIAGWLIGTGHVGVGLVILVAVFVLPSMATTWMRVAQSRKRAAKARADRSRNSGRGGPP